MKVLTVDDSRMIRTLVRKYLTPLRLEILEAPDGQAGLEAARKEKPDLIILDVNMPVMDGSNMLRALRQDPETKGLKVLMLTAESAEKTVLELIKMGISDYIVKPFEEELLVKKVCKILKIDPEKVGQEPSLKKVLVVDNNESILMVARRFLQGMAEVYTTSNPEKALQLASQHKPEVVFLDLQTDAVGMVGTLKREGGLNGARFICLTTPSHAAEAEKAKASGFSDVLLKPFDKETLTELVMG